MGVINSPTTSNIPSATEISDGENNVARENQRRYDRGIRVWGAHGQENLEKSRVCLLNAGATGSEALKNLVLGGISFFTIVDGNKVKPSDLGANYLVTENCLGHSRAECVAACLKELNENVHGSYIDEEPGTILANRPEFFAGFDIVIGTQLHESDAVAVDNICRAQGTRLLLSRSYGLVGYVRNCVPEVCIIESRPDNEVHDLRLGNAWPQLKAAAMSIDLDTLDEAEHSHIPYAIILIKAAEYWKASHQGELPKGSRENSEFKDLVRSWQRTIDGCPIPEENFIEAVANAHLVWAPPRISSELKAVLDDEKASFLTPETPKFWILVAALRRFFSKKEEFPLQGSLPDMHATTQQYISLQHLYRKKAEEDCQEVSKYVYEILKSVKREQTYITVDEVKHFCSHARHLRVVRTGPLSDFVCGKGSMNRSEALRVALLSEESSHITTLHLLLRAVDRFSLQYQRYPGTYDNEVEEDTAVLKTIVATLLQEMGAAGAGAAVCDDLVREIVRFGAGELHLIASFIGAIASQEAIKLLTNQFVPIGGGSFLYSGMKCSGAIIPD